MRPIAYSVAEGTGGGGGDGAEYNFKIGSLSNDNGIGYENVTSK